MAKRILWLTENYPPQRGGMAQSCDRIVNGLRNVGYQIEVIHFTVQPAPIESKTQQNGSYTAIGFEDSEPHTLNVAWNHIKEMGEFDFIASYGGHMALIGAPVFSKWLPSKLLVFLRGNDFDSSVFALRKRDALHYALSEAEMVLSVSGEKIYKIERWVPSAKVHHVPNGIDLETWKPSSSELDFALQFRKDQVNNKYCFGLVGQLKAKKGIKFFLDAMTKTNLQDEIHFMLVGDVTEEDQQTLTQVKFTYTLLPFLDRYELLKYYLCCDALVIPSFYEGMPNVLLEAGALGIPIIASNVDGMADVISHQKDGLLFKVGNADDCRKTIYEFVAMPNRGKALGETLKEKIEKNYTSDHEIQRYQTLLG